MKNCPLCDKLLVKQSTVDACGYEPAIYCPEEITQIGDNRKANHYREDPELNTVTMYVGSFRILTKDGTSKVGTRMQYKTRRGLRTTRGRWRYKTLIEVPIIHPDTEERLYSRIKLLLLLS